MTDIDILIRDLEAATEGSRESDGEVMRAAGFIFQDFGGEHWAKGAYPYGEALSPDFSPTTSLDDALTLVPEGYSVQLTIHPAKVHNQDDPPVTFAHVYRVRNEEGEWDHGEHEARMDMETVHPALALCIAALKAWSAA